jgi:hexosaminidase
MRDVEYMAFPRLLALAEVASTQLTQRSWDDFRARLLALERRLDELGVAYHRA